MTLPPVSSGSVNVTVAVVVPVAVASTPVGWLGTESVKRTMVQEYATGVPVFPAASTCRIVTV